MSTIKQRTDLEATKQIFKRKKEKTKNDIKSEIDHIEMYLNKMKEDNLILDNRDPVNPFYERDKTKEIQRHTKKLQEIFNDLADEESNILMEEEDIENEAVGITSSKKNIRKLANKIITETKKDALKDKESFDGKTTEKITNKISSFTIKKPLKLLKEDGTTGTSLANADGIKSAGYWLLEAIMVYDSKKADYQLICTFQRDEDKEAFTFKGFSFGYGGEGPNGLIDMLKTFGYDTVGIRKKTFDREFIEQYPQGKWIII